MPTADSGQKDLVWAAKDTVAVNDGDIADLIGDSPFVDLIDANDLLPDSVNFNFSIDSVGAGAIFNMLVYAIFSEDGVGQGPPQGSSENKKILVASLVSGGADEVLAKSNLYSVPCLGRHFRLAYQNDGSGGQVTISSRYAGVWQKSYSA